jgi:uncharacterized protein YdeI (YjbR/CyaY-like superfamily)
MTNVTELDPPESPNGKEVLVPATREAWRHWLSENADRDEGLWVVFRKKTSDLVGPDYDDLVEEALCFGWIDSVARRADGRRRIQWFSPRRRGGLWSALNKQRIERLEAGGRMTGQGRRVIDEAIADGSWSQADDVDSLIVPEDLERAFDASPRAREGYESLSDSEKKQCLWRVYGAKREQTRTARIEALVRELSGD